MENSIYAINKGINKSIEFRGLRAQYIWIFGSLLISLMVLFAILYIAGTGSLTCFTLVGGGAAFGTIRIFAMSREYGEHGLMKAMAQKKVPKVLKSYSREFFRHLKR